MKKPKVILIHGIFSSKYFLYFIGQYLKKEGYDITLLDYPSTQYPLEKLVEKLHPKIKQIINNNSSSDPIHFVCHSMGGLLLRAYLEKYPVPNLGRVVFLATPNQGSELADVLSEFTLFKWLFGPAGQQLKTTQTAQVFKKPIDFELGVVMGNKPTIYLPCFKGENDGNVSVESSKLPGIKDHVTVPKNHLSILLDKNTQHQINHFFKKGHFYR